MNKYDSIAAFIVPTGVGASIGGFAGDASPAVNMISKICPVITNPNVVNGAIFSGINENILYTEGYAIDAFFKGELALRSSKQNKIGVIFDKAIPKSVLNVHINTINAVESVYGIKILDYTITNQEVGVNFSVSESGISTGNIKNSQTLIDATKTLLDKGAEALAVVCYFEDSDDENYSKGSGVDPVGGVEAIISHLLTREFMVPVVHAPAFGESCLKIPTEIVDKRAAAEYITPTFLPCLLLGLYNAPKLVGCINAPTTVRNAHPADCHSEDFSPKNLNNTDLKHKSKDWLDPSPSVQDDKANIYLNSVKALIMPANCLGGIPVLKAIENNIPVLVVEENKTVLDITPEALGLEDKIIKVKTYQEAADYLRKIK